MKRIILLLLIAGGIVMSSEAAQSSETLAIHLIAKHEGFRAKPYRCPGGQTTIGYGFTDPAIVAVGTITRKEADRYLGIKVRAELSFLRKRIPNLAPHAEAATVSFIYNVGRGNFLKSTFFKRLKEGNMQAASKELNRWIYSRGIVLDGLVARRAEESKWMLI